jgi:hypothetical protein
MLDILFELLLEVFFYIIFLPITFIISTPIILIKSFFGKKSYTENIKVSYSKVFHWWERN